MNFFENMKSNRKVFSLQTYCLILKVLLLSCFLPCNSNWNDVSCCGLNASRVNVADRELTEKKVDHFNDNVKCKALKLILNVTHCNIEDEYERENKGIDYLH